MKIAHISDIHVYNKKTAADFAGLVSRALSLGTDHFIISGDLVNSGTDDEYRLLVSVLKDFDIYNGHRLSVIPGNHDLFSTVFGKVLSTDDLMKNKRLIPSLLSDILRYSLNDYIRDLEKFNDYLHPAFEGSFCAGESFYGYPHAKILSGKVAVICIDSNLPLGIRNNLFASNGHINLHRVENLLSDPRLAGKTIIPVIHHCLYPMGEFKRRHDLIFEKSMILHNRDQVTGFFENHGIRLVLHGHYHVHERYTAGSAGMVVLNSGRGYAGDWHLIDAGSDDFEITSLRR